MLMGMDLGGTKIEAILMSDAGEEVLAQACADASRDDYAMPRCGPLRTWRGRLSEEAGVEAPTLGDRHPGVGLAGDRAGAQRQYNLDQRQALLMRIWPRRRASACGSRTTATALR